MNIERIMHRGKLYAVYFNVLEANEGLRLSLKIKILYKLEYGTINQKKFYLLTFIMNMLEKLQGLANLYLL